MDTRKARSKIVDPATAKAPGKVILTGEHFVVLGASALSMAIDLYSTAHALKNHSGTVEVEATIPTGLVGHTERDSMEPASLLKPLRTAAETAVNIVNGADNRPRFGAHVHVECEIPVGAGLGSSASTSVAIIDAVAASLGRRLGRKEIFELAFAPEKLVHKSPSGIDQATSTFGGIIQYRRGGIVERVRVESSPNIVVCDTGIHRSTGKLVSGVVNRSKSGGDKQQYQELVREVDEITRGARKAILRGDDDELGNLMDRDQELLVQIGVSHPSLDRLVRIARESGATGAKLTGAGGGGCMIAVCKDNRSMTRVSRSLERAGGHLYDVQLSPAGVTLDS